MQSDAQARQESRPRDGVRRGGADHQARRAEDSMPMSPFDRLVHFGREAEIVRGDDEPLQATVSSLSRRNWKNSTPSRRRRLIISGLRIISPTIEAIFDGRK